MGVFYDRRYFIAISYALTLFSRGE